MKPADLLFTQGFGTRRECASLVASGCLEVEGAGVIDDFERELDVAGDLWFRVRGGPRWPYRRRALVVMNKPAGCECSQKPRHHASVYSLLPAPLRLHSSGSPRPSLKSPELAPATVGADEVQRTASEMSAVVPSA